MSPTVIFSSQADYSPRITRFWCAPDRGYVPMRVEQKKGDDVQWTMEIKSFTPQLTSQGQVFGSVTPCWPWYLPPRSL